MSRSSDVSESQERCCAVEPANVGAVIALSRMEVNSAAIGTVTETGRMRVFDGRARRTCPSERSSTTARYTTATEKPAAPI